MSSSRLPAKMLRDVGGRPLIERVMSRAVAAIGPKAVVVATSSQPTDDPLADWCARNGVVVYRGDLDDVSRRLLEAAQLHDFDHFVRVNGDSPLIHPALIQHGLSLASDDVDLVTNVYPRSYPKGQSVEVIRTAALALAVAEMQQSHEREHVTVRFYKAPERWSIRAFTRAADVSAVNMSIDTAEDAEVVTRFLRRIHGRDLGPEALIETFVRLESNP